MPLSPDILMPLWPACSGIAIDALPAGIAMPSIVPSPPMFMLLMSMPAMSVAPATGLGAATARSAEFENGHPWRWL